MVLKELLLYLLFGLQEQEHSLLTIGILAINIFCIISFLLILLLMFSKCFKVGKNFKVYKKGKIQIPYPLKFIVRAKSLHVST